MALTKKDLLEFGQILKKDLKQELKQELSKELTHSLSTMWRADLRIALAQQSQDIKRDIRDEMGARFNAFGKKVRVEIAETITDNILPAINRIHQDLKQEIRAVRNYVGMTS